MIPLFLALATQLTPNCTELSIQQSWRLKTSERFDLSGILAVSEGLAKSYGLKSSMLLVNDKSSVLYQANLDRAQEVEISPFFDIHKRSREKTFDLESIDAVGDRIYVVNEFDGRVFELKPRVNRLHEIRLREIQIPKSIFKENPAYKLTPIFGIEALAASPDFLILGKEMPPLALFKMDFKTKKFQIIKRDHLGSQTDMRIRDKFLYVLNREARQIHKLNLSDFSEVACVSVQKTIDGRDFRFPVFDGDGIEHPEYGTAEGLEIVDDLIYVALDNNGQGLKFRKDDQRPVIIAFKRPTDF